MSLCIGCMKEPVFIKYCQLGRKCYLREWRKSQGPGTKYRLRAAAIAAAKRSVGAGVCGEVHPAPTEPSVGESSRPAVLPKRGAA